MKHLYAKSLKEYKSPSIFENKKLLAAARRWRIETMKKLTKEEKEILHSIERGEWKPIANRKAEIRRCQSYARETLRLLSITGIYWPWPRSLYADARGRLAACEPALGGLEPMSPANGRD